MNSKNKYPENLDPLSNEILEAILYFEIFSYPLTLEEIVKLSNSKSASVKDIKAAVNSLTQNNYLYKIENFYASQDRNEWVEQRKENNLRAVKYLEKAQQMSRLINKFPFVRAVFVSGSLSKDVMAKKGDIDYFIITKPGRLWVSRGLLILYKKLFLFNSHEYFCINYLVDEDHLEIEEKNRFTATEIITILPMLGQSYYHEFLAKNDWVKEYYPNYPKRSTVDIPLASQSSIKGFIEKILNGRLGEGLDRFFMKKFIGFWKRKFKDIDTNRYAIALKSKRNVSKHHPQDFQLKVMKTYKEICSKFEQRNGIKLQAKSSLILNEKQ